MQVTIKVEVDGDVIFQTPTEIPLDEKKRVDRNHLKRVILGSCIEMAVFILGYWKEPDGNEKAAKKPGAAPKGVSQ